MLRKKTPSHTPQTTKKIVAQLNHLDQNSSNPSLPMQQQVPAPVKIYNQIQMVELPLRPDLSSKEIDELNKLIIPNCKIVRNANEDYELITLHPYNSKEQTIAPQVEQSEQTYPLYNEMSWHEISTTLITNTVSSEEKTIKNQPHYTELSWRNENHLAEEFPKDKIYTRKKDEREQRKLVQASQCPPSEKMDTSQTATSNVETQDPLNSASSDLDWMDNIDFDPEQSNIWSYFEELTPDELDHSGVENDTLKRPYKF